jgi:hypothetical protein
MVAPDASDVILQLLKQVPGLPQKRGNIPPQGDGFAGVVARLLVPVRLACGRTTTSSMMTADLPAGDGRRLAWLACPLRSGVASRGFEGGWRIAHGVVSSFFGPPPPRRNGPTHDGLAAVRHCDVLDRDLLLPCAAVSLQGFPVRQMWHAAFTYLRSVGAGSMLFA